jgi:hypothetical protein
MTLLPLLLCWSNLAKAIEADCDGVMCATPIIKGQPAPYDGLVLTPQLASKVFVAADECDARTKEEVEFTRKIERLEIDRLQKLMQIDKETHIHRTTIVMQELENAQAWYRQPAFIVPVSVVVTIGIVVATGYALQGIAL